MPGGVIGLVNVSFRLILTAHWRHLVRLYGEGIGTVLGEPCSAFVAEGWPIMVHRGRRIV